MNARIYGTTDTKGYCRDAVRGVGLGGGIDLRYRVPDELHFQQDFRVVPLGWAGQPFVFERIPFWRAVTDQQQRYGRPAQELHLVVGIFVIHGHLQHRIDVLYGAVTEKYVVVYVAPYHNVNARNSMFWAKAV